MAAVLILQFMNDDGPAHLGTWLRRRGVDVAVCLAEGSPAFPERIDGYRALALLGGSMSVNDDFAYLRAAERLIEHAMDRGIPVLGHCLGGQLMARTLGAEVGASSAPEIGWHRIACADVPERQHWFGPEPVQHVFQWHTKRSIYLRAPSRSPRARRVGTRRLRSGRTWHCSSTSRSMPPRCGCGCLKREAAYLEAQRLHDSVHGEQRVRDDTLRYLVAQQRLADRIYEGWLRPTGLIS